MRSVFDRYSLQARVFPVYITISPIILGLAAILPQGLDLPLGVATAIVFVPLAFLASQVGADFGKRLEKPLWIKWGGPPTTRFLRHSNGEFNRVTRQLLHTKLRSLGLHVPSADDQQRDLKAADAHWEACTEVLIRRTRDHKRFPLVYQGLTEYGFRRNLLGLKPFGLTLSIVALLACPWKAWDGWVNQETIAVPVGAVLLSLSLFVTWVVWVKERTVAISANRYARFLLEAAQELE